MTDEDTRKRFQNWAMRGVMPNSQKNDFWTPKEVFDALDERFGPFTLDVASSEENSLCINFYTMEDNGLEQKWDGIVWCNPPYVKQISAKLNKEGEIVREQIGRGDNSTIKDWVLKAYQSVLSGDADRVLVLIPSYLSNHYWHDIIFPKASHLVFFKSRLDFQGPHMRAGGASRNPSVAVVFSRMWSGVGMQVLRMSNKGEWLTEEIWDRKTLELKLKNGVEAFGHELEGDKFVVLKGSTANSEARPSWRETERRWREKLVEDGALKQVGEQMIFTRDVTFNSKSAAASQVRAVQSNGRKLWVEAN